MWNSKDYYFYKGLLAGAITGVIIWSMLKATGVVGL